MLGKGLRHILIQCVRNDNKVHKNYYAVSVDDDLALWVSIYSDAASRIVKDLCWEKGYDISSRHVDCGEIVYKVIEKESAVRSVKFIIICAIRQMPPPTANAFKNCKNIVSISFPISILHL